MAAAAIIMVSVFAGFIGMNSPTIQTMGVGLAAAVAFDAFLVRMAIAPAVLALLGHRAWWLPRILNRVLPDVDIEGESLSRHDPAAAARAQTSAARRPDGGFLVSAQLPFPPARDNVLRGSTRESDVAVAQGRTEHRDAAAGDTP